MSRNGSGVMAVPNSFTAGTTILSSDHNENFDDIEAELTNSVAADGQTTITGPLKGAAGSAAAPGYAFSSDLDTGMYRIGGNNLGLAVGGTKIVDISSTGIDVTGSVLQNGAAILPTGTVLPWAGTTEPTGFLFCYGQAISRTTYAALFAIIATVYGTGDGSTTFNVPDLRGRVIAGQDDMGGSSANRLTGQTGGVDADTLGASGGTETHTLATAEMPSHAHTLTDPGHFHTSPNHAGAVSSGSGVTAGGHTGASNIQTDTKETGITMANTGGGGAHNNVQPTFILNFVIKT